MKTYLFAFTTALMMMSQAQAAPEGSRPNFNQYCNGKAINTIVNLKNDGHPISGTCQLGFKANATNTLERGAMRDPIIQNACKGKSKGAAVTVKLNGKAIAGKCDVIFKSEMKRS